MVWKKFRHNGVAFPKSYEAKKVLLKIKGKKVEMNSETEEMAYAWVKKNSNTICRRPNIHI